MPTGGIKNLFLPRANINFLIKFFPGIEPKVEVLYRGMLYTRAERARWLFFAHFFYTMFSSTERGASSVEILGSPRH